MYAEKSWGYYTVVDVGTASMTIRISMRNGEQMSYHCHEYRDEVWVVASGHGIAIVDGMEQQLSGGDVITIAANCKHMLKAITDMSLIEIQLGNNISVEDKKKYKYEVRQ
jgi:mannose-1-phosphate guanylyltransferase